MVDAAFTGNLTRAPRVTRLDSGKVKVTAKVAVNDSYRNASGEWVDLEPVFFSVEAWGERAALAAKQAIAAINSTGKNPQVMVQGKWRRSTWQDEQTGEDRQQQFVLADSFAMVPALGAKTKPATAADENGADTATNDADSRWSEAAEAAANE